MTDANVMLFLSEIKRPVFHIITLSRVFADEYILLEKVIKVVVSKMQT